MSSPPDADDNRPVLDFELRVGERSIQAKARLPAGEVRMVELLPILRKFNDAIIGAAVEDAREEGRTVSCCAGCGACCRQVVPISEHEALALLEWVEGLPADQQAFIRSRFEAAVAQLDAKGMLERTRQSTGNRDREESVRIALDYFRAGVACPFLVNESCSIHPIRPMKCREYLVTSPAKNCQQPSPESIAMVNLPTTFSKVLFHFEPGEGPRWLPLILLFEWDALHRRDAQRKGDSVALFREFLAAFVDQSPEALEQMLMPGADVVTSPKRTDAGASAAGG
jgi:Fe-S-cluster containining protein